MKKSTPFRNIGIVAGVSLFLLGLFADGIGIGLGRRLGHVQLVLIILGISILYLTVRRDSLSERFSSLAIVSTNTIILFLVLELLATAALRLFPQGDSLSEADKSGLDSSSSLNERPFTTWIYRPFVLYRVVPETFTGSISTDVDGFRISPEVEAGARENGCLVYCLGGSTMWGWGEVDTQTIPAHLQILLSEHLDCPVEVVNLGQPGWLSSQELIQLLLKLWEGERPDLVIFYDGGNDVAASARGEAGTHLRRKRVENLLSYRSPGETAGYSFLWQSLKSLNTINLLSRFTGYREESGLAQFQVTNQTDTQTIPIDSISKMTLKYALGNYRVALSLGNGYGFDCLFLWQPLMAVTEKYYIGTEKLLWEETMADSTEAAAIRNTWLLASEFASEGVVPGFVDISDALDTCSLHCYIDRCHLNGTGNKVIAESIFEEILQLDLSRFDICGEIIDD